LVWEDTHLILVPWKHDGRAANKLGRKNVAVAVKRRTDRTDREAPKGVWRVTTLRLAHTPPRYAGYWWGRTTIELTTHRALAFKRARIKRSKKYVRFGICL
jgi:hypothetical protein